jgi:ABC-2 type transport system ATP-binding protein
MMTSSSDELLDDGVDAAVHIKNLRVIRGKRPVLHDFSVQIARGTVTGCSARPGAARPP